MGLSWLEDVVLVIREGREAAVRKGGHLPRGQFILWRGPTSANSHTLGRLLEVEFCSRRVAKKEEEGMKET